MHHLQDPARQVRRGEALLQEMYLNGSQMRWLRSSFRDEAWPEEVGSQVTLQCQRGPNGAEYPPLLHHSYRP